MQRGWASEQAPDQPRNHALSSCSFSWNPPADSDCSAETAPLLEGLPSLPVQTLPAAALRGAPWQAGER